jgi:hypothetical protein
MIIKNIKIIMKMFSVVGRAVSSRCASKVSLVTPTDAPTARLFLENLSNFYSR